jgi:hypothetical protein
MIASLHNLNRLMVFTICGESISYETLIFRKL